MNNKYCLFIALSLSFCVPSFANETFWKQLNEGLFDQARKTVRNDPTVDVKWKPDPNARSAAAMVLAAGPDQADLLAAMWAKHSNAVETVSREEMLSTLSGKSKKKISLSAVDEYGTTYMHWLCFSGSQEKIGQRLKNRDYTEVVDFAGDTPLHYAISGQNIHAVAFLISMGVNLEARNDLGETPLIRALATAHQVGATAHIIAIIGMLLGANADVHAADIDGATPLHFAVLVKMKSQWLAKELLDHGANAHAVSKRGTTPLSNAASAGHHQTLLTLVAGAKIHGDKSQPGAIPPLHAAAQAGHASIVKYLIRNGADVDVTDANGDSAYDVAANAEIRGLLKPLKLVIKVAKRVSRENDLSEREEQVDPQPAKRPAAVRELSPVLPVIDLTGPEFQAEDVQMRFLAAEVDDYLNRNVRNRDRVRFANGAQMNVRVVGTQADGHCGFRTIGLDRQLFIDAMLEVYGKNNWVTDRLDAAMKAMRVKTIQEWAKAYARILDNGHAAVWLDQTHMELISAYFNIRFHIYIVDPQHADGFIEQPHNHVIYEGQDPQTATDFDIAYVALAHGQPLIHLERLEIVRDQPAVLGANAVNRDTLNNMFQEFVAAHGQQAAYALLLGIKLGTMYGRK